MSAGELERLREAVRAHRAAQPRLYRAIYEALQADIPVTEVAREAGYNREHIRRIRVAGDKGEL